MNKVINKFRQKKPILTSQLALAVNGGVKTFHWGGAKVGHFGARVLDRVALI